jgi:drug/metabolite transporter (DMT)-like permease
MAPVFLGLIILILWSFGDVLTASAARQLDPERAALGVCIIGMLLLVLLTPFYPILHFSLESDVLSAQTAALSAGILWYLGYWAFTEALTRGHPASVYAIVSSFSVIVVLTSWLIFDEPISSANLLALGCIIVGVLLNASCNVHSSRMTKPALLSALCWGAAFTILKYSMEHLPWSEASFLLFLPSALVAFHRSESFSRPLPSGSLSRLIGAGVLVRSGDCLYNYSLAGTQTAIVASIAAAYPVLGGLISHFLFRDQLSRRQIIGILVSSTGIFLLAWMQ